MVEKEGVEKMDWKGEIEQAVKFIQTDVGTMLKEGRIKWLIDEAKKEGYAEGVSEGIDKAQKAFTASIMHYGNEVEVFNVERVNNIIETIRKGGR